MVARLLLGGSRTRCSLILVFGLCVFGAVGATAQEVLTTYDHGNLSFDYDQWPFGSINGTFSAAGALDMETGMPVDGVAGCGGALEAALGDTVNALSAAVIVNDDGSLDVAIIFVRFPNGPTPGTYGVDLTNFTAGYAWLDDVVDFQMPEGTDYAAWLDALVAAYKFVSTSGSVTVSAVDNNGFTATFSGMMADAATITILTISAGQFAIERDVAAPVPLPAASGARLVAGPNPFNPQTRLALTVPRGGPVSVAVFDLSGRRIRSLHDGVLDEGDHAWVWNGLDDRGVRQSGGIYFCRAVGTDWRLSRKLVLVP